MFFSAPKLGASTVVRQEDFNVHVQGKIKADIPGRQSHIRIAQIRTADLLGTKVWLTALAVG